MEYIKDFKWKKNIKVHELVDALSTVGFQSIQLGNAAYAISKMKKEGAKVFFTFTSNMVSSGLRGLFAQVIEKGFADTVITTVGAIEEDIMKANGENFIIGKFSSDDVELYETGHNRVGNILIKNDSYIKFEDEMQSILSELYKNKKEWLVSELLYEIGKRIKDENSILHQAALKNIPVFCPAITDGALGFHLYLFKEKHKDFNIDIISDFKKIMLSISQDDKKGVIALGGGVSKHHALLASLLNGGVDYAVYMTTARESSGSVGGATTNEAKSWGKIKDDSDAATVIGDVSITFPLVMCKVFDELL